LKTEASSTTVEEANKAGPPNQEHTPQLEKEQGNLFTPKDKTSKGKTISSSTTAKKRTVKP